MTLTANEAVQVLEAMRTCLNPLWVKYGDDWRRDEALRMAIEKIKESEKMIKEIQFQRSKQRIFAMDENYQVIGDWECRDDYIEGYNSAGDPRGSLPDGVYTNVSAEVTNGAYGAAYGTFYITSGDPRGRDIHGGGSGLPDPYADYQGWVPTYGCLRMQNADGEELSRMIIASGNNVVLTVVE